MENGTSTAIVQAVKELVRLGENIDQVLEWSADPQELLAQLERRKQQEEQLEEDMPELPDIAFLPPEVSAGACPWMDEYIAFASKWSPWSFSGYHKSIGLWALSVVAAGRVALTMGRRRLTPLYIAIIGRTSVHAKTEAAMVARDVLRDAGLGFLLGSQRTTPQKLLTDMSGKVPLDYEVQDDEDRQHTHEGLAFAGQKGWYCDEYGGILHASMQKTGPMADFHALLRELDDGDSVYSSSTVARGSEKIENPYLALLASMTPADLIKYAGRGSALWRDGYLARFALVIPDQGGALNEEIFPNEERSTPTSLTAPLKAWHERLGTQSISITKEVSYEGKETGRYKVTRGEKTFETCILGHGVFDAYSNYVKAMRRIVSQSVNTDLDGSITRLPGRALRVAMLIASLENAGFIDIRHWAWAQEYTEQLRSYLYHVYQTCSEGSASDAFLGENKIILSIRSILLKEKKYPTAREIALRCHTTTKECIGLLDALVKAGVIEELSPDQSGRRRGISYKVCTDPMIAVE